MKVVGEIKEKRTQWLFYTVLVGLLPVIFRLLIFFFLEDKNDAELFNTTDIIAFGLVLNITNITRIEFIKDFDKRHKTRNIGISIMMIAIFSLLFSISLINQLNFLFNEQSLIISSSVLSVATFCFSYSNFKIERMV